MQQNQPSKDNNLADLEQIKRVAAENLRECTIEINVAEDNQRQTEGIREEARNNAGAEQDLAGSVGADLTGLSAVSDGAQMISEMTMGDESSNDVAVAQDMGIAGDGVESLTSTNAAPTGETTTVNLDLSSRSIFSGREAMPLMDSFTKVCEGMETNVEENLGAPINEATIASMESLPQVTYSLALSNQHNQALGLANHYIAQAPAAGMGGPGMGGSGMTGAQHAGMSIRDMEAQRMASNRYDPQANLNLNYAPRPPRLNEMGDEALNEAIA